MGGWLQNNFEKKTLSTCFNVQNKIVIRIALFIKDFSSSKLRYLIAHAASKVSLYIQTVIFLQL